VAVTVAGLVYGLTLILGILLDGCFKLDFTGLDIGTGVDLALAEIPALESTTSLSFSSGIGIWKSGPGTRGNGSFPKITGPEEEDEAGRGSTEPLLALVFPLGAPEEDLGSADPLRSFEMPRMGLPNLIPCHFPCPDEVGVSEIFTLFAGLSVLRIVNTGVRATTPMFALFPIS